MFAHVATAPGWCLRVFEGAKRNPETRFRPSHSQSVMVDAHTSVHLQARQTSPTEPLFAVLLCVPFAATLLLCPTTSVRHYRGCTCARTRGSSSTTPTRERSAPPRERKSSHPFHTFRSLHGGQCCCTYNKYFFFFFFFFFFIFFVHDRPARIGVFERRQRKTASW